MEQTAANESHPDRLNLISTLCQALKTQEVLYCHWKSNAALDLSASGDNDLDLLIGRTDVQFFNEILHRLGFKQANAPLQQQLPGVIDYYGYDADSERLVHVHAHYQLIIGHDRTKNYRLPIERPFLKSVTQGELFKVPTVEFEYLVFIFRMALKYSTWDAILSGQGSLPANARRELAYLQPRVDRDRLYDILQQCLPFIDKHLFEACERSLSTDCLITERISTGRRLQKRLRAHARRQHVFELGLKFKRRLMRGIRRRLPGHLPKKRLTSGGAMIALVGGDGAGKSTATGELYSWLSDNFDTIRIHLGRPSWSWLTYVVRAGRKVGQLVSHSPAAERKKSDPVKDLTPWSATSYSKALWYVCVARDRYRAYTRARRFATNGGIVICDRFPLEQVRLMDGPRIKPGKNSRIVTFLGRLERNYYLPMTPPEVLIVLKVDPDIAVRRKTEEDPVSVRRRSMEIWQSDWQETQAHVIDASRSPKEVLSELKSLIWSEL